MANPTEQQKAQLSQQRGKTIASEIKTGALSKPADIQKAVSAQGDLEAKGKLNSDAASKLASRGTMSFHKGGVVPKDGTYRLKKGEGVVSARKMNAMHRGIHVLDVGKNKPKKTFVGDDSNGER